ncbi:MAG: phycocyanobilin:ferredoxin oxidoreductase [Prochlorococcaceae cyanobacterium]
MGRSAFCWAQADPVTSAPAPQAGGIHPLVDALAESIRRSWEQLPELEPLEADPELEAISGQLDGDDLFIRNELRRCRGLRKLHLETARLGAGLQILHCVFFPDPRYDLPVFGADIVAGRGGVSAAIVDLSPVAGELPAAIAAALAALPPRSFRERRELPGWGTIFSPHVCFVRPADAAEERSFIAVVEDVLAVLADGVRQLSAQASDDPATVRRWEGQLSYCQQQKQNDKTRRVLEKAFNPLWADRYIETMLFDDPPRP